MKIRRFTGTDMPDAMRQVRAALGRDAVILETAPNAARVEISAAMDAQSLTEALGYRHRPNQPRRAAGHRRFRSDAGNCGRVPDGAAGRVHPHQG